MKSTMTPKYIIGSISSGTMRPEDLIPAFCDCLDDIRQNYVYCEVGKEAEARHHHERINDFLASIEQSRNTNEDYYSSEDADYDLEKLFDMLNEYSAPYFYFGSHPGDGADYGFWLPENFEQDFVDNGGLKVADTSEVPADYTGEVLHVSDHGNPTLYSAENGKLTEIWSLV